MMGVVAPLADRAAMSCREAPVSSRGRSPAVSRAPPAETAPGVDPARPVVGTAVVGVEVAAGAVEAAPGAVEAVVGVEAALRRLVAGDATKSGAR